MENLLIAMAIVTITIIVSPLSVFLFKIVNQSKHENGKKQTTTTSTVGAQIYSDRTLVMSEEGVYSQTTRLSQSAFEDAMKRIAVLEKKEPPKELKLKSRFELLKEPENDRDSDKSKS